MRTILFTSLLAAVTHLASAQQDPKPAPAAPTADAASPSNPTAPASPRTKVRAGVSSSGTSSQNRSDVYVKEDNDFFQFKVSGGPEPFMAAAGNSGRSLVIRTTESDPKKAEAIEEEMRVMGRILEKSADPRTDSPGHKPATFSFMPMGGLKPARNIFVEGYGAVFMLNVNFPLLPPPEKPAEAAPKEPNNSEWEEAKNEVYGNRNANLFLKDVVKAGGRVKFEEYDAHRVDELKENILKALKNASNIQNLQGEQTLTVVVSGGPVNPPSRTIVARKGGGASATLGRMEKDLTMRSGPGDDDTTMTVKVKKSDIDALAKNTLSQEEFTKRAKVAIY